MPYDGERSQEAVIDFLSAHVGGEGTVDSLKDVVKEFVLSDESSREKVERTNCMGNSHRSSCCCCECVSLLSLTQPHALFVTWQAATAVKKAISSLTDEEDQGFGKTYEKVVDKVMKNGMEYISKEVDRVGRIISTGSVGAEKLKEMKVRRNILRAFQHDEL